MVLPNKYKKCKKTLLTATDQKPQNHKKVMLTALTSHVNAIVVNISFL